MKKLSGWMVSNAEIVVIRYPATNPPAFSHQIKPHSSIVVQEHQADCFAKIENRKY